MAMSKKKINVNDAVWQFTMDTLHLLSGSEKGENVFVSPLSIMSALSMVLAGARDETAKELKLALHFGEGRSDEDIHKKMAALQQCLTSSSSKVTSSLANKVYVEKSFSVLKEFKTTLTEVYKASCGEVSFKKDSDGVVKEINKWVAKQTNGKITDLLASGSLTPLCRVVLINAIHFKGTWMSQFEERHTQTERFYKFLDSPPLNFVPMMRKENEKMHYSFSDKLQCHCVRLSFKDKQYALYLIVPEEKCSLPEVEKKLAEKPESIRKMVERCQETKVHLLKLPKFRISCLFDLEKLLPQLGIKQLFNEAECNLSGISDSDQLFVSSVIHKAFLEVNEEGAEAAAVTFVGATRSRSLFSRPVKRLEIIADHPFLVAICYDKVPIFIGRINDPKFDN